MRHADARLGAAVGWIAARPFLGDIELGGFLGIQEADARWLREELGRRGWVEWVVSRGDGREARPLAVMCEEALPSLAGVLDLPLADLTMRLPVGRAAVLERLGRIEAVQDENWMLAVLASQLRRCSGGVLEAAWSLPLPLAPSERWWPPRVQAFFRAHVAGEVSSCFVAWDRAGAPDSYRRARVRAWFDAPDGASHDVDPPLQILVACAGDREMRVWEKEVLRGVERRGTGRVDVLLATVGDVLRSGALHTSWFVPGAAEESNIVDWMRWQVPRPTPQISTATPLPAVERTLLNLRVRLVVNGTPLGEKALLRDQVASLSLVMDAMDRVVLEWVLRHPWLTVRQIAILLNDPELSVSRRLEVLSEYGTVRNVSVAGVEDSLWIGSRRGLRLFAASEDVPLFHLERDGAVTLPPDAEDRPGEVALPRTFEHDLGVIRAFVRLAEAARRDGGRLIVWRNETESAQVFFDGGEERRIRPDGSGVVELGGVRTPFLMEYERGTLKSADLATKLRAYERYYATEAWDEHFDELPVLFFVCVDERARRRVAAALTHLSGVVPAVLTTDVTTLVECHARVGEVTRERILDDTVARQPEAPHQDDISADTATGGIAEGFTGIGESRLGRLR